MNVLIPADIIELQKILEYSIQNKGPFYIRLPREEYPLIHSDSYQFKLGIPDILKEGTDICLIGTGYGTHLAMKSALLLEKKENISTKIINLSSLKPIQENILISEIKNVQGVIVIEEHNIYCGVGSIISRIISEKLPKPMQFIGVNDTFSQSAERSILLKDLRLTVKNIIDKVKQLLEKE
ncbi:MAG: transketolase C-terminal domain-containing protein, partial [Promethearchaeota archaeon]